jgi:zinc transporter 9
VHAAVDGVALGAISSSGNQGLELVVFAAILLHKAPAAFGLASFLISQGQARATIVRLLLCFSVAAPVTALITCVPCTHHAFTFFTDFLVTKHRRIQLRTLS